MTTWRCPSDGLIGYCKAEPKWDEKPHWQYETEAEPSFKNNCLMGGTCKLSPDTCGKHLPFAESLPNLDALKPKKKGKVPA